MTAAVALSLFAAIGFAAIDSAAIGPEQRAVDYLAHEVPAWQRDNHCYSCHNNGDGARALYAAARLGYAFPKAALEGTGAWLERPSGWDRNPGTPGFSNAKLARIQFAAALAEAVGSGLAPRPALLDAARLLLPDQDPDGAWKIDTGGAPGAPATYGIVLATYLARRTLEAAGAAEFSREIARADDWLESAQSVNLLDRTAMLLALPRSATVRRKCLDMVLDAQTSDGGWGPQAHAPAEPFDTAIVLLAFDAIADPKRTDKAAARGRASLIARQQADGSWLETTRPPGQLSYAEHISTTAWALDALLVTGSKRP